MFNVLGNLSFIVLVPDGFPIKMYASNIQLLYNIYSTSTNMKQRNCITHMTICVVPNNLITVVPNNLITVIIKRIIIIIIIIEQQKPSVQIYVTGAVSIFEESDT